jgi:hypothetical protein
MDITWLDGAQKGQTLACIYSLEKDRLQLCFPRSLKQFKNRPAEFKTREADGLMLLVLERVGRSSDPAADEFGVVLREWRKAQKVSDDAFDMAKTADERRKLRDEISLKMNSFAERCLKLAQASPDAAAELAALCWAARNAPTSEAGKKALAILKHGRIAQARMDELSDALKAAEPIQELASAVLGRIKNGLGHPRAAELLTWVCTCYSGDESVEAPRTFAEAADLIAGRFADSADINHFCEVLGIVSSPSWAGRYEQHLRTILDKNQHRKVRYRALFVLASVAQNKGEARQDEAEKLYQQFVRDYDGRNKSDGVEKQLRSAAQRAVEEIRIRGIGKPAPEIEGEDLDGKSMRLSDYNGKVVLLDFWAFW